MIVKPKVLVYRETLLRWSETFIPAQAEGLNQFTPIYVGARTVNEITVTPERMVLLNSIFPDRFNRLRLKLVGPTRRNMDALRRLNPALIHAHFGMDAVDMIAAAKRLRIPLLFTHHGWDATVNNQTFRKTTQTRLYVQRYAALTRAASRIICVSDYIRRAAIRRGAPEEKTVTHYIGVDLKAFADDPKTVRKNLVLFAGRLVEKKGCEYLIRAMSIVSYAIPDAELVVIGEGPEHDTLEKLASSLRLRVRFLSSQPQNIVCAWMKQAKVFCVPSIVARSGDAEGFGMVFIEAQALGTPVVSFATGGIPEAVSDGKTGLLAPEKDVAKLADNIVSLLANETRWISFSRACRDHVQAKFDLRQQTGHLEDIYLQALAAFQSRLLRELPAFSNP